MPEETVGAEFCSKEIPNLMELCVTGTFHHPQRAIFRKENAGCDLTENLSIIPFLHDFTMEKTGTGFVAPWKFDIWRNLNAPLKGFNGNKMFGLQMVCSPLEQL